MSEWWNKNPDYFFVYWLPSVLKSLTEIFFIKKVHNENIACYSFSFVDAVAVCAVEERGRRNK